MSYGGARNDPAFADTKTGEIINNVYVNNETGTKWEEENNAQASSTSSSNQQKVLHPQINVTRYRKLTQSITDWDNSIPQSGTGYDGKDITVYCPDNGGLYEGEIIELEVKTTDIQWKITTPTGSDLKARSTGQIIEIKSEGKKFDPDVLMNGRAEYVTFLYGDKYENSICIYMDQPCIKSDYNSNSCIPKKNFFMETNPYLVGYDSEDVFWIKTIYDKQKHRFYSDYLVYFTTKDDESETKTFTIQLAEAFGAEIVPNNDCMKFELGDNNLNIITEGEVEQTCKGYTSTNDLADMVSVFLTIVRIAATLSPTPAAKVVSAVALAAQLFITVEDEKQENEENMPKYTLHGTPKYFNGITPNKHIYRKIKVGKAAPLRIKDDKIILKATVKKTDDNDYKQFIKLLDPKPTLEDFKGKLNDICNITYDFNVKFNTLGGNHKLVEQK